MSGVVVITARHDGVPHGMTVSAVSSLSLDPPIQLVCLKAASATQEAVRAAGRFAVNILAEHQGHVAEQFARPGTDDTDGYIGANHAFHRFLVEATGIRALADAYEQLSLPDVMARALSRDMSADSHLVADHLALIDALERRDLAAARRVLTSHNEHAKATQRAGMQRLGGWI